MSIWTHVNAVFRIDSLEPIPDKTIEKIFGKEILYEDLPYDKKDTLPMGSEGTLHKVTWHNPDKSVIASTLVSVFGDLRDYSNSKALKVWFEKSCKKVEKYNYWIRQAIIQINVEGQDTLIYSKGENYK